MKRRTSQRAALDRVFRETAHPMTVEQILGLGRESVPTLNLTTVYRNLKRLTRNNLIRSILHPVLGVLYERTDKETHHHFYCRVCLRVYDLPGGLPDRPPFPIPAGFKIESHDSFFCGVCPVCAAGLKK